MTNRGRIPNRLPQDPFTLQLGSPEERLTVLGHGGWVLYRTPQLDADVYLRLDDGGVGRLEIVELHVVRSRKSIDSNSLRALNLGRVEGRVNDPGLAAVIREDIASVRGANPDSARVVFLTEEMGSLDPLITLAKQRARALARRSLGLSIPKGTRKPDEFYREVAEVYTEAAGRSRRPAQEIAAENGQPATTVHRWVKEARRRGLLASGQRS